MSTIAWDGRTIAADRQTSTMGCKRAATKLFDCGEWIYGGVGDLADVLRICEWLRTGMNRDKLPHVSEDSGIFGIAVEKSTRKAYIVEDKVLTFCPIENVYHAEGSGRAYALTAMRMGYPAPGAVLMAMEFDPGTGMGLDSIEV